jgi:hypothetical protein
MAGADEGFLPVDLLSVPAGVTKFTEPVKLHSKFASSFSDYSTTNFFSTEPSS